MALSIGLDTAVKALRAHQLAVDVASHNIANAQTPGFSRQRVLLRPVGPSASGYATRDPFIGRPGYGVEAKDVNRIRDIFLDYQWRQANSSASQFAALASSMGRAEVIFDEPADQGIAAMFGAFFNAWQDVVNDPESLAARTALVHAASTLTTNLQRVHQSLSDVRKEVNAGIVSTRDQINSRAEEIAQLNVKIVQVEANGDMANDLRDRRDLLIDELSGIAQITASESDNGAVNLYLGNHELVTGGFYRAVKVVADPNQAGMQKLIFEADGDDLVTATGSLAGLMEARDVGIPGLITKLNNIASAMITQVNALHTGGFDLNGNAGVAFFSGTDASSIAVNAALLSDPRLVAASSSAAGVPGNSQNALAIANLQQTALAGLNNQTLEEAFANMVSVLGADVARANGAASATSIMTNHIEQRRQGVAGVNLDEEITNLNAAQNAYNAAARIITAIDEMLDTLINRTGVVGR